MLSYIETTCRWAFSLQMIFWGFNSFFHWLAIPPSSKGVTKFVEACVDTRFIMPTVKFLEIVCGIFLLCNFAVLLNILIFAPIVFVITLLHLIHNSSFWSKFWPVVLTISLPFLIIFVWHIKPLINTLF